MTARAVDCRDDTGTGRTLHPDKASTMSEPTQAPAPATAPTPDDPAKRLREKLDKLLARDPCRSEGSIVLNGRTLKYRAIAEFVPVVAGGVDDKRGDPEAAIFTTSYLLDAADPATRPVCFVFNGGPGSASIWLHLGALGPKRVVDPRGRHDAAAARTR